MTKKHELPHFEVLVQDLEKLKQDIKDLSKGTEMVMKKAESVKSLAFLGSPELKTMEVPKHERFEPLKRDAMAIDNAGSLMILASGLRLIAEYAIPSAYATKALHVRMEALEKSVGKIAEETNVDLSQIKQEMSSVKSALQSPLFTDVVKMFKEGKETAEKTKKRGDETFDHLTRSH